MSQSIEPPTALDAPNRLNAAHRESAAPPHHAQGHALESFDVDDFAGRFFDAALGRNQTHLARHPFGFGKGFERGLPPVTLFGKR